MNVALWAEVRRLKEIEKLSERKIALRLHCSRHSVAKALRLEQPPTTEAVHRGSLLEPYLSKIDALVTKHPDLSAVRIHEEIARGPDGFTGMRPPTSGRSTASRPSARCCAACRRFLSTPTKSCRPWSVRTRGSNSTAIVIRRRPSSCASRS